MKHDVSTLEGAQLDAAVARCEGWNQMPGGQGWAVPSRMRGVGDEWIDTTRWEPKPLPWSSDWQHGGAIIEREQIALLQPGYAALMTSWEAGIHAFESDDGTWQASARALGPSPLIAAMRAYVASRLGRQVDLP
jgi:hypothetical protein